MHSEIEDKGVRVANRVTYQSRDNLDLVSDGRDVMSEGRNLAERTVIKDWERPSYCLGEGVQIALFSQYTDLGRI